MKSCIFETLEKQSKWPEGALFQIFHFNMGLNYPTEVIIEIPKKIENTPLRDHCVLHAAHSGLKWGVRGVVSENEAPTHKYP